MVRLVWFSISVPTKNNETKRSKNRKKEKNRFGQIDYRKKKRFLFIIINKFDFGSYFDVLFYVIREIHSFLRK